MIRGPARYFRHNAFEPELAQIKRIDERIDRANRIALVNPFIEAFGQHGPFCWTGRFGQGDELSLNSRTSSCSQRIAVGYSLLGVFVITAFVCLLSFIQIPPQRSSKNAKPRPLVII